MGPGESEFPVITSTGDIFPLWFDILVLSYKPIFLLLSFWAFINLVLAAMAYRRDKVLAKKRLNRVIVSSVILVFMFSIAFAVTYLTSRVVEVY